MSNYPEGSDNKYAPWNQGDAKEGVEVVVTITADDEDDALDKLEDYLAWLKQKGKDFGDNILESPDVNVSVESIFLEREEL